ncbi:MAG: plastocyanin/azurin family copper-binding protein [Bacillota bacterium]
MKPKSKTIFNYKAIVLGIIFIITLHGCSKNDSGTNSNPTGNGTTSGTEVNMQSSTFSPSSITVAEGTTVTWINKDTFAHTVTSGTPGNPDGKFDSGNIGANGRYSFKFEAKGTYNYYCVIHASMMKGVVIVQ